MELVQLLNTNIGYAQIVSAFLGAFFAFMFFVLGELCLSSSRERERQISELERMKEYVALQVYFFEQNNRYFEKITEIQPISITFDELKLFPIEECVYQKIGKFRVVGSTLSFVVHLRVLNENMKTLNSILKQLSDFSKIAILEKRQSEFVDTMNKNLDEFQKNAKNVFAHMQSTQLKIDYLAAEIELTLHYVRSFFLHRWYFVIRAKFSPNFREEHIKKLINVDE